MSSDRSIEDQEIELRLPGRREAASNDGASGKARPAGRHVVRNGDREPRLVGVPFLLVWICGVLFSAVVWWMAWAVIRAWIYR